MTPNSWFNWVILSVSLFNTIILVWLGLTVLLSAERRTWGVWLGAGGLLLGAAFFVSHSALVAQPLFPLTASTDFWWHAAWAPVILSPFAWYVIVLWYTGFWDLPSSALGQRQRPWLAGMILFALVLAGLLLFGNPLPTVARIGEFRLQAVPSLGGIPVLILAFPVYIVLCTSLALDALLRPGPSARFMGDKARRSARPWLIGTSVVLLAVSLLVAWVMLWLYELLGSNPSLAVLTGTVLNRLAWLDLLIESLIGLAVLLIGQAVVSYEIFTGRILPRKGFRRQWQNAIILAADVGSVVAASQVFRFTPIYSLLLITLMLVVMYALFTWRTQAERERLSSRLRPFVTSQRLYEQLLDGDAQGAGRTDEAFAALCQEVLDTSRACLVALGPLAPLVGPPLFYPPGTNFPLPDLADIIAHFTSPQSIGIPLDSQRQKGLVWAAPLWSERGLVGVLLLGEKQASGFYTQEEIEISRASGERLVDSRATAEIGRRLIALQRQRLVESQVLDRQTRRVLHDDVLPLLHTALLQVGAGSSPEAVAALVQVHRQISDLLHDLPPVTSTEVAQLGFVGALTGLLEGELGSAFDHVHWQVEEAAEKRARVLPALPAQVLFYAAREVIRNAARYARQEPAGRALQLTISICWRNGLAVEVEDNGAGLPVPPVSGEGSGQGLALHSTMMAVVGGTLSLESQPGVFTRVGLFLPESALG